MCFISLKLDIISYECLGWTLRSLAKDELTPSLKGITNRVKEAFAFRMEPNLIKLLCSQIQGVPIKNHHGFHIPKLDKATKQSIF